MEKQSFRWIFVQENCWEFLQVEFFESDVIGILYSLLLCAGVEMAFFLHGCGECCLLRRTLARQGIDFLCMTFRSKRVLRRRVFFVFFWRLLDVFLGFHCLDTFRLDTFLQWMLVDASVCLWLLAIFQVFVMLEIITPSGFFFLQSCG